MPDPIDVAVGERLRIRRTLMGLSQSSLADDLGLTFQQVQKYEKGANRISASKLYNMAILLDVPVSYFFDGVERNDNDQHDVSISKRETLELVRAFYKIDNPETRQSLVALIKAMS